MDAMHTSERIPLFPRLAAAPLTVLPLYPIQVVLDRFAKQVGKTHPKMFRRMREHAHARFELDPTDLPFLIQIEPRGGTPSVRLTRSAQPCDARIAGPMAALLGMVHGAYDGDALFFSRDLVIEGDTAAVLALRNAIDAAEIDLTGELAQAAGPARVMIERLSEYVEKRTGVALTRHEEAEPW